MELAPEEIEKERIRLIALEKAKEAKERKRELGYLGGCFGFIIILLILGLFVSLLFSLDSPSQQNFSLPFPIKTTTIEI